MGRSRRSRRAEYEAIREELEEELASRALVTPTPAVSKPVSFEICLDPMPLGKIYFLYKHRSTRIGCGNRYFSYGVMLSFKDQEFRYFLQGLSDSFECSFKVPTSDS
jgi:hypothetical protein